MYQIVEIIFTSFYGPELDILLEFKQMYFYKKINSKSLYVKYKKKELFSILCSKNVAMYVIPSAL